MSFSTSGGPGGGRVSAFAGSPISSKKCSKPDVVFQHLLLEGMHLTELAERAQITKQSMGYLVDYLQERGYVERVPDLVDGRAKLVRYTERGREVDRVTRQIVQGIEEDWACRLGEHKMDQLRQLLKELIAELEKDS